MKVGKDQERKNDENENRANDTRKKDPACGLFMGMCVRAYLLVRQQNNDVAAL